MPTLDQWTDDEIALGWCSHYSKRRQHVLTTSDPDGQMNLNQQIDASTIGAVSALQNLSLSNPDRAWRIILLTIKYASEDENVLDNLVSGPLESLLRQHGSVVIEWAESEAYRNPEFKELLAGVCLNSGGDDPVSNRIKRAIE